MLGDEIMGLNNHLGGSGCNPNGCMYGLTVSKTITGKQVAEAQFDSSQEWVPAGQLAQTDKIWNATMALRSTKIIAFRLGAPICGQFIYDWDNALVRRAFGTIKIQDGFSDAITEDQSWSFIDRPGTQTRAYNVKTTFEIVNPFPCQRSEENFES
jgi:hypothetical protein